MKNDPYWSWLDYKASTGATAKLKHTGPKGRGGRWLIQLSGDSGWFGKFRTKFDALLFAAREIGLSGEKADWSPM